MLKFLVMFVVLALASACTMPTEPPAPKKAQLSTYAVAN
jgi:hypothetical protein